MKKFLLLSALILIAGKNSYSQSVRLENTVISETSFETKVMEISKNVTIITKEEISNSGAKTLGEVLRKVPSLTVSTIGGADATFDLRGQGDTAKSNVLVLLDGTPLNTIDLSGYKTSQIDLSSIVRIEVIPSGGSVLYGDGAVGGIINIITDSPLNTKNYGTVALEAGSYDYGKIYGSYGTAINEDFLLKGSYSSKNRKGYRDETKDDLDDFQLSGKYLLTDGALSLGINHSKNSFSAPGALGEKDYHSNPTSTGGEVLKGENTETLYHMNFNKKLSQDLELLIYGNYKNQEYRSKREYEFTPNWNYNRDTDTETAYIKPHLKYQYFPDAYIVMGVDFYKGNTEVKKTGKYEKESTGIFALNKFTTNRWEFSQGYRYQTIEYDYLEDNKNKNKKFNQNALDLSANYNLNSSSSIYFTYVTAFRTPNTDELGYWDSSYGLEPQSSKTFEIGGKSLYGNTYVSGAIYRTLTENEIIFDDTAISPSGWNGANRNLEGENSRIGAELFLEHYFGSLTLRESFSYIKTEIKDGVYSGKEIPAVPRYLSNLGLTYDVNTKLKFNSDLNYRGKSYSSADFKNEGGENSSYLTLDINLQYKVTESLNLYGGINNLTDKKYAENIVWSIYSGKSFYPANGRNYYLGMKYEF